MKYLIYNIDTLYVEARFETEQGAKTSWTRKFKKNPKLAVTDVNTFRNEIDYEVDTINILNPSAGPIKIRKSLKGTCCDPATERYHSM